MILAFLALCAAFSILPIRNAFLRHYSEEETAQLAELLGRLPGAGDGPACTVDGDE